MRYKVMLYGSLKKGFYNNPVLPKGSRFIKNVKSKAGYTMISLGAYPGVIAKGSGTVYGELWDIPDIKPLDKLEGNGRFYTRYEHGFEDDDGNEEKAWIYLLPDNHKLLNVIKSGQWTEQS